MQNEKKIHRFTCRRIKRKGKYYAVVFDNGKFTKTQVIWEHWKGFTKHVLDLHKQKVYLAKEKPKKPKEIEKPIKEIDIPDIKPVTKKVIVKDAKIRQVFKDIPIDKYYKAILQITINEGKGSGQGCILREQEMHLRYRNRTHLFKILLSAFSKITKREFMAAVMDAHEKGRTGLYISNVNGKALLTHLLQKFKHLVDGESVNYKGLTFNLSFDPTTDTTSNSFISINDSGTIATRIKKEEKYADSKY